MVVLEDDGCNTTILSNEFVDRYHHLTDVHPAKFQILHSDKTTTEVASKVVLGVKVDIAGHLYTSNRVVANARYDVILGMPWHV